MEHFLPKEYTFDAALHEVREPLVDDLFSRRQTPGDIIDPIREFSRPVAALWTLSEGFAKMYAGRNEDVAEVQAATYRGLCFGLQVVDDIRVAPIDRLSISYLADIENERDAADIIDCDVSEYLENNPEISSLLFSFRPELDPTYQYGRHAERAAGFAFMISERQQADQYLTVQLSQLESCADAEPLNADSRDIESFDAESPDTNHPEPTQE